MATVCRMNSKDFVTDEFVLDALLLLDISNLKDLLANFTAIEVFRMSPSLIDDRLTSIEEFPETASNYIEDC